MADKSLTEFIKAESYATGVLRALIDKNLIGDRTVLRIAKRAVARVDKARGEAAP